MTTATANVTVTKNTSIILAPKNIDDYDEHFDETNENFESTNEIESYQPKEKNQQRDKKSKSKPKADDSTQSEVLLRLAEVAKLFHTEDGTCYADITINGHRETHAIRRKSFDQWLRFRYYLDTGGLAPNNESMNTAINSLEARARFDSAERQVFVRVGGSEETAFLDLGNAEWEVVRATNEGWDIICDPEVRFHRPSSLMKIPRPEQNGDILALRQFVNVGSENDFVLVVAWLLATLRHSGPYPVMVITGEQGSAKSTFCKLIKMLIDPQKGGLRTNPKNSHDLFIAASNSHIVAIDNVSGLSDWLSDSFCRLATGGGFATRELYTNSDETIFEVTRPSILNGIEQFIARPDLADRAIFIELKPIPEEKRRPEADVVKEFEEAIPKILGGLLDALVVGFQYLPTIELSHYPRMADFAKLASACEKALWANGTFSAAYSNNRQNTNANLIESDILSSAIQNLMTTTDEWKGTATKLLSELTARVDAMVPSDRSWPKNANQLSKRLNRSATVLRRANIEMEFTREGKQSARIITIKKIVNIPSENLPTSSVSSVSSAEPKEPLSPEAYRDATRGQ